MLEHGSPEIGLYQYRVTGHQVSLNDFLLEGFLHLGTMKYIHWYWNYEIKFQNLTKEQQLWNTSAETGRARGSPWLPLFKGFCLPIQTLAFSSFNISNDSSNFWTILLDWQWDILYSLLGLLSASITAAIFDNWFPPVHAKWLTLFSHCTSLVLSLLCYFFHEISLLGVTLFHQVPSCYIEFLSILFFTHFWFFENNAFRGKCWLSFLLKCNFIMQPQYTHCGVCVCAREVKTRHGPRFMQEKTTQSSIEHSNWKITNLLLLD